MRHDGRIELSDFYSMPLYLTILSVLLAITMLLYLLPANALAEDVEEGGGTVSTEEPFDDQQIDNTELTSVDGARTEDDGNELATKSVDVDGESVVDFQQEEDESQPEEATDDPSEAGALGDADGQGTAAVLESQGSSIGTATPVSFGSTYYGSITSSKEGEYYRFSISSAGRVSLTSSANVRQLSFYLYDASGKQLWYTYKSWDDATNRIDFTETFDLTKGTYYVAFVKRTYGGYTGPFSFSLGFQSANVSFEEPQGGSNNSMTSASSVSIGRSYNGQIALNDEKDFYRFSISSAGRVSLTVSANMRWLYFYLYDASGKQLWYTNKSWDGSTNRIDFTEPFDLTKGDYYLAFVRDGQYTGPYSFTLTSGSSMAAVTVSSISDQTYTGSPIKPTPRVSLNGTTLTSGTDYTLSYASNTNVGTATITMTGKGKYNGAKSVSFSIVAANISNASVSSIANQTYNGSQIKPNPTVTYNGKTLSSGTDYTLSYANNTSVGTATITLTGKGNFTGTKKTTFRIVKQAGVSMYRMYNPNSGEHFYTASESERDGLKKKGWKYEGIGWVAPATSATPVYRLYSGTDHHYTTSASERDNLKRMGWKYEGVGWYSDDAKGVPLYRLFNPNVKPDAPRNNSGSHHYTTSSSERDSLARIGWSKEGIGWYGMK